MPHIANMLLKENTETREWFIWILLDSLVTVTPVLF